MADSPDNKPQTGKAHPGEPQTNKTQGAENKSVANGKAGNDEATATPTDVRSQPEVAQAAEKPDKTAKAKASQQQDNDERQVRKSTASANDDRDPPSQRDRPESQQNAYEDENRPAPRWRNDDRNQRSLFNEDDGYDRRDRQQARYDDRDDYRQRGGWAQDYGHTQARGRDEDLSRQYGDDYRRYSNQTREDYRNDAPDRYRDDRTRDSAPRGWNPSGERYRDDDRRDDRPSQPWASQGNQDRHRDWDRDPQGRYSNTRPDDRYNAQDNRAQDNHDRDYRNDRRRDDDRWRGHYGADSRERDYRNAPYQNSDPRDQRGYSDRDRDYRERRDYADADQSFAPGYSRDPRSDYAVDRDRRRSQEPYRTGDDDRRPWRDPNRRFDR